MLQHCVVHRSELNAIVPLTTQVQVGIRSRVPRQRLQRKIAQHLERIASVKGGDRQLLCGQQVSAVGLVARQDG
jgi:hypothetical protein